MSYAYVSILKRPGEFDQPLTYKIPDSLKTECSVGQGVLVPLRGKLQRGIVVELVSENTEKVENVKEIEAIVPELHLTSQVVKLARSMATYYRCSLLRALKLFIPKMLWTGKGKRILKQVEEAHYKKPVKDQFPLTPLEHELTTDQKTAIKLIEKADKPVLLHGVTGSGKTEIYLRIILEAVRQGKQAIMLVPEIAITPQMIEIFERFFGKHLAILHSKLSDGQRMHEYAKIQSGYSVLTIGSRSALFAPVENLGVLIIDEEHEWTYKQESAPYYETHKVADMLFAFTSCKLIFGSATPRLETLYKAKQGDYQMVELPHRVNIQSMPPIQIVDLREEFQRRNFSIFSKVLFSKIKDRLQKKEQIILFVNQRGVASSIMCRDCGMSSRCPKCEVSLKLHGGSYGSQQYLMCHYCAYRTDPKLTCDACGSSHIKQVGLGTERVEEELFKSFPEARVIRADKDSTSDKYGFEPIYKAFKRRDYDVLVGTQMVAKGLDFPHVTLIGIMLADIGLHIPDFRSHERLFQLITQVSGRAGRGEIHGEVILQTYQPEHHAIKKAASYAYDDFAAQELQYRQKLRYPPFSDLIKFTVVGTDIQQLQKELKIQQEILEDIFKTNNINGTILIAPAMISKINQLYYYHVLIRGETLQRIFDHWKVPRGWRIDIDPVHTS